MEQDIFLIILSIFSLIQISSIIYLSIHYKRFKQLPSHFFKFKPAPEPIRIPDRYSHITVSCYNKTDEEKEVTLFGNYLYNKNIYYNTKDEDAKGINDGILIEFDESTHEKIRLQSDEKPFDIEYIKYLAEDVNQLYKRIFIIDNYRNGDIKKRSFIPIAFKNAIQNQPFQVDMNCDFKIQGSTVVKISIPPMKRITLVLFVKGISVKKLSKFSKVINLFKKLFNINK